MNYRTYQIWKFVLIMILVGLTILAVFQAIAWIPVPAMVIVMAVMLILRRRVREVVVDERSYNIASQASRITFQAGALIMVAVGITLMALSRGNYPELESYGYTLIYGALGFIVLYLCSVLYYTGKHGGAEEL
jgi:uncharacterized membrane protein